MLKGYGLVTSIQSTRKLIREKKIIANLPTENYKKGGYMISEENLNAFIKKQAPETFNLIEQNKALKKEIEDLKESNKTPEKINNYVSVSRSDIDQLKEFSKREKEDIKHYLFEYEIGHKKRIPKGKTVETFVLQGETLEQSFKRLINEDSGFATFKLSVGGEEGREFFRDFLKRTGGGEIND